MTEPKEKTGVEYEELEAEYRACRQQLQSKEQALRILQSQLKKADLSSQRLKQEMKQLRSQLSRSQQVASSPVTPTSPSRGNGSNGIYVSMNEVLIREKEQLIQELEKAHWQISNLERQVEQLKDEKDDMADEKMHYVNKYEGLVKCLEDEKKRQPPSQSTVQRVMEENKQLQLALVEAKAGKEHFKSRVERFKDAIERKKSIEAAAEQVAGSPDKKQDFKLATRRIAELESLANNLTETVKVKSVTISHQKKANKMLATDLAKLQHRLNLWEASCTCGKVGNSDRNSSLSCSDSPAQEASFEWKSPAEGVFLSRKLSGDCEALLDDITGNKITNGTSVVKT